MRGRLYENVIIGTDAGLQSARQLGADKRISMWQPDFQVGVVVLQAPPVTKINHPVPLLPDPHAEEYEEQGVGSKDNSRQTGDGSKDAGK